MKKQNNNNNSINIKLNELEILNKLQKNELNELRKTALLNLPELLRAIYIYSIFEA